MPCFQPVTCWKAEFPAKGITFKYRKGGGAEMQVPCNQCIGCRLAKSKDWATRITHEASLHENNSFITLTFNEENHPWDSSVSVRDVQLFIKRLRKSVGKLRFFACGEYGSSGGRPHYHLIIFGYDFPDKTLWRKSTSGYLTYRSPLLEKLWPLGFSEIGTVTPGSAGYIARYALKKVTGPPADEHYTRINPFSGELNRVRPEFIVMSTKPGIGSDWYDLYSADVFPSDFLVLNGQKVPVPRYYSKKIEGTNEFEDIKEERRTRAKKQESDNTPERLATREESANLKADRLLRDLDNS